MVEVEPQETITVTRRRRWLLTLAATASALLAAVVLVFVRTAWGQRLDNAALATTVRRPAAAITASRELLATIDVLSLAVAGLAIMTLAVLRGRPRLAVAAGTIVLGANVTTQLLKHALLTRPALLSGQDPVPPANTLPSGHATVAMSLALAFVLVTPPRWRPGAAVLGGLYAVAIGSASVIAGGHRPSDVLAASLVATAWAAAVTAVLLRVRGADRVPGAGAGWSWVSAVGAVALAVLAATLAWGDRVAAGRAYAAEVASIDGLTVPRVLALAVGLAGTAGTTIVLVTAFAALLHGLSPDAQHAANGAATQDRRREGRRQRRSPTRDVLP